MPCMHFPSWSVGTCMYVRFIDTPGGSKKKIRVGKNWPMSKKKKALVDSLL